MNTKLLMTFVFIVFGLIIFSANPYKVKAAICTWVGTNGNWDNPSNWTGCSTPGTNDQVRIPNNRSTNNNIVGLTINSLTFTGSTPGGTLTGNELIINSLVSSTVSHTINLDITLGNNIGLSTNSYNGVINLNGHNLSVNANIPPWGIAGQLNGSGIINASSSGNIFFTGGADSGAKQIFSNGSTDVYISGSGWDTTIIDLSNGGGFSGPGALVRGVVTDGTGIIQPSRGGPIPTTQMEIGGPDGLNLNPGDTIVLTIAGTTLGTDYDSILSNAAPINLSGVNLSLYVNYSAPAGDSFTILESSSGITGEFNGFPDGSIITAGGRPFQISYLGTTVTLTVPSIGLSNPTFTSNPVILYANQPFIITSFWLGLGPTATGSAELFNGSTSLGTVTLVNGVATFNIAGLPAGDYSLTVEYFGDVNFVGRVSDPLNLTIVTAPQLSNTGISMPSTLILFSLILSSIGIFSIKKYYEKY